MDFENATIEGLFGAYLECQQWLFRGHTSEPTTCGRHLTDGMGREGGKGERRGRREGEGVELGVEVGEGKGEREKEKEREREKKSER